MRHTSEISAHTLIELERACADLRLVGAPDNAQVRMRVTAAMRADGGHPRSLTGQWDTNGDITPAPSPSARPLHGGPWGRPAIGPIDK